MNPPAKPDMPLRQFIDQVYAPLRLLGTTGKGHQQYRTAVNRFAAFLGRDPMLSDLNETTVAAFLADSVTSGGIGPVTANSRLRMLRTLHRFARRKKFPVPDLEDVDKLPVPKRLPKAWTMPELENLLSACADMPGRLMGVPESRYWKALILLLYDTGLRISATRQIRWNEIDFKSGVLSVPAERMKNLVEQTFTLHPQTIEAIVATLPPRRRLIFSWPFGKPHVLWDRLRKLLKLAGLPDDCKSMFHRLRRTCATHLASVAGTAAAARVRPKHPFLEPTTLLRVSSAGTRTPVNTVYWLCRRNINRHARVCGTLNSQHSGDLSQCQALFIMKRPHFRHIMESPTASPKADWRYQDGQKKSAPTFGRDAQWECSSLPIRPFPENGTTRSGKINVRVPAIPQAATARPYRLDRWGRFRWTPLVPDFDGRQSNDRRAA
jgi:integrase